jgi:RNA polymerase sigma factor (TIGR02999 family)
LRTVFRERIFLTMTNVTEILNAIAVGDPQAASQLLPLVYAELRELAARKLAQQKPGQTLDATALVHDAYLRLVGPADDNRWNDRSHFFAAAAEAMRHILVDNARRKRRPKHGGDRRRVELDESSAVAVAPDDLLALDEALTRLAAQDPVKAQLVQLRFFAGLTMPEAARVLGVSLATVERYWTFARLWLYAELNEATDAP